MGRSWKPRSNRIGPDRRLIAQSGTDRIVQIVEADAPRTGLDGAAVEKQDAAEVADEGRAKLGREAEHAVAANGQAGIAERGNLITSPAANRGRAAQEVFLGKRHECLIAVRRADVSRLRAIRPDQARADRQIVPAVRGDQPVAERAREESARLLDVKRRLVAASGVQEVVRRRVLQVEADDRRVAVLESGGRVEPDGNEVVPQPGVAQYVGRHRARLALGRQEDRPGCGGAVPVRHHHLRADHVRPVRRRQRVPVLARYTDRKVRREEVRLVELETDAAIERRPPRVHRRHAGAAHEIEMPVLGVDPGAFLASVAGAEIHPLVFAFGHRHTGWEVLGLLIRFERLHRHELEQFHAVQTPLGVLNQAAAVEIAGLIGELTLDHAFADAAVSGDRHRPKARQLPGLGIERDLGIPARAASQTLVDGDPRIRVAVIAQLVQHQFLRRDNLLPVPRLADLERHAISHGEEVVGRNRLETGEADAGNPYGLALGHRQRHIGRILLAVQLHVERRDSRIRITPVGVKGLDASQIGVELRSIEVVLLAPRQYRTGLGRQCLLKLRFIHGLDAVEGNPADLDAVLLVASGGRERRAEEKDANRLAAHELRATTNHATA